MQLWFQKFPAKNIYKNSSGNESTRSYFAVGAEYDCYTELYVHIYGSVATKPVALTITLTVPYLVLEFQFSVVYNVHWSSCDLPDVFLMFDSGDFK